MKLLHRLLNQQEMIARNKTKRRAFTLIELLVVIAIIAILTILVTMMYKKYTHSAKCTSFSEQHRKVVAEVENTFNFCRLNGLTYLNTRGSSCRDNKYANIKAIGLKGNVCERRWDCQTVWGGRTPTAGLVSGYVWDHLRAQFDQPNHTGGFFRQDQWKNFEKAGYPARPGITNVRDKGDDIRIATYLGEGCKGGDYKIDEVKWP